MIFNLLLHSLNLQYFAKKNQKSLGKFMLNSSTQITWKPRFGASIRHLNRRFGMQ